MAFLQDTQVVLLIWVSLPTVLVRQVAWLDREPLAAMPAFRRGGAWSLGSWREFKTALGRPEQDLATV